MSDRSRILSGLAAELTFAILPLLVVLMVVAHQRHSVHLFASPEWSFGSAILFGQSLVKFISGIVRGGGGSIGPIALLIALVVVFGLVPSLFVLTVTLQSFEARQDPTHGLQVVQVVLFCSASVLYIVLGAVAELWNKP